MSDVRARSSVRFGRGAVVLALAAVFVLAVPAFGYAATFVTGTVTDAGTTDPIAGATVGAYYDDGGTLNRVGETTTLANGTFTLDDDGLGAGDYEIYVSAEGYIAQWAAQSWGGGAALNQNFALVAAKVIATGYVTDASTGDPIPSAMVDASVFDSGSGSWMRAGYAFTDVSGFYTVYDSEQLGPDDYTLSGGTPGYAWLSHDRTWNGTDPLSVDFALEKLPPVIAVEGVDRFMTAIEVSKLAYPGGADGVIIATGRNWPDALGGTALAGALDVPILLVEPNAIPGAVADEIDRLGADWAIILGGSNAVGTGVELALKAKLGSGPNDVERIAGNTRYETADKIATRVLDEGGSGLCFVATGGNFPDALAAAPLAAAQRWPLLLAHPVTGFSDATKAIIEDRIGYAVILGGTSAVSVATEQWLVGELGDLAVDRLDGANRYETAVKVATWAVEEVGHEWDRVGITTGENFPDALAGGVLQGQRWSVMVLTPPASLHPDVAAALTANASRIAQVTFFGGTNAISQAVRNAAVQLIE
jgi:putative cell wall-binding protein